VLHVVRVGVGATNTTGRARTDVLLNHSNASVLDAWKRSVAFCCKRRVLATDRVDRAISSFRLPADSSRAA
jgi:hypothetical protein